MPPPNTGVPRPITFLQPAALVLLALAACAGATPPRSRSIPPIHLALTRVLPAPAAVVFAHLHEPGALGWLGRFRLVRRGVDPREPAGLASTRRVSFVVPLVEETITAFDPPCALDYAVTYSRAYAQHHASMRLTSMSDGSTRLDWSVTFASLRRDPQRHARFTRWYLRRALVRLERHLRREARRAPWPDDAMAGPRCYGRTQHP